MYKSTIETSQIQIMGVGNGDATVRVLERNHLGLYSRASGTTVPNAKKNYALGCEFTKTDTGATYRNTGSITSCTFTLDDPAGVGAIAPPNMSIRTAVALPDAAATPTIAQLMTSSIFTMTPGAARNFTTPIASLMVAGVPGAIVGNWFDFTIVNLADFPITLVAGDAGVTLSGSAIVLKGSATFRARLDNVTGGAEALTIYRTDGLVTTSSSAELDLLDGSVAGTAVASKALSLDAQKAVDTLRATGNMTLGGTGVPGAATTQTEITKAVTAFTDTTAKDVFTVTIPNAVHAAVIEVDSLGSMGAGGAIGAGESCKNSKYHVTVARTAGVNAVATVSAEVGTGAAATVAGAAAITSVVVTASAVAGAVGDPNTFTIKVAITKAGGAGDNHTLVASARILNKNATGITIA